MRRIWPLLLSCVALIGCASGERSATSTAPEYRGVQTELLQDDLVNFHVEMRGARGAPDVEAYARCAAAQYALRRGFGFARHVRTSFGKKGGLWTADAVYTISAALPPGVTKIDAEVVVAACRETGIPTV